MIVITHNGRKTVVTGWRAWLAGISVFLVATLLFAFFAFVMLGVAITVGAVLLIVVPIALGVALLASIFRTPNGR